MSIEYIKINLLPILKMFFEVIQIITNFLLGIIDNTLSGSFFVNKIIVGYRRTCLFNL